MRLRNGKAAGEDRIQADLLKSGGSAVIDWLTELLQEVWRTRQVLQEWKDATLVHSIKRRTRGSVTITAEWHRSVCPARC